MNKKLAKLEIEKEAPENATASYAKPLLLMLMREPFVYKTAFSYHINQAM